MPKEGVGALFIHIWTHNIHEGEVLLFSRCIQACNYNQDEVPLIHANTKGSLSLSFSKRGAKN